MNQAITRLADEAAAKIAEFDSKHNGSWYCTHEQKNIARIVRETLEDAHLDAVDFKYDEEEAEPSRAKD